MTNQIKDNTPDSAAAFLLSPEEMVEQLRLMRPQIAEYGQLTVSETKSIVPVAALDPRFIIAAINAMGASGRVEAAIGRTAGRMRQVSDENTRWMAVEDELRSMLKGVVAANRLRRHDLGLTALQTYQISRQLVRHPENADLLPHVDEMKRLVRLGRKRSKPAETRQPVPPARK